MTTISRAALGTAILATFVSASVVSIAQAATHTTTIHGCVAHGGALRVVSSAKKCSAHERALSWNARGPKGSAGAAGARGPAGAAGAAATSQIVTLSLTDTPLTSSDTRTFLGTPATVFLSDARAAAIVNASLDFASDNGAQIDSFFEVCYQASTGPVQLVNFVEPNFAAAKDSYFAQSVTGVVGGLTAGVYKVGICTAAESSNVIHGNGAGWVEVVQTTAGVTSAG
jgi:hypothetical protein